MNEYTYACMYNLFSYTRGAEIDLDNFHTQAAGVDELVGGGAEAVSGGGPDSSGRSGRRRPAGGRSVVAG